MYETDTAGQFTEWMRAKRSAPETTTRNYHRIVGLWIEFMPTAISERTSEDVEAFTSRPRRTGRPAAPATVANEVAILGSFYKWGIARLGWLDNPATLAARPKVHNRQPRPVDDETWMRLWNSRLTAEARVALGLGYFAGLRRAEIVALRGNQVWGRSIVNFTRKGGGEDRVDLGDLVDHYVEFLPHLIGDPETFECDLRQLARQRGEQRLMSWPSTAPRSLNKRLRKWLVRAGFQPDEFTPHQLRHSFATNLLDSKVPLHLASDLCNHSSVNVTMRYIKTSGGRLAALRTNRPLTQGSNHAN